MTQYDRDRNPNADSDPPASVVNKSVRKAAVRTYLGTITVLFLVIGAALLYFANRDPQARLEHARERMAEEVVGTTGEADAPGAEGERSPGLNTPGGFDPQPTLDSPAQEVRHRGGYILRELRNVLDTSGNSNAGRRVEITGVEVERVDGPTLFWVRDGDARVAVVAPAIDAEVRAGEHVDIVGSVDPSSMAPRIRAARVMPAAR